MGIAGDLRSALERLTSPPVATFAAGLIFALLLGVVGVHLVSLREPSGGRIETGTGDFLAFWTGAVALHEGRGETLYDFTAQRELQSRILGGRSPQFQPYLNPPLLAVLLSPVVPLGFVHAFWLYDLACVAALAVALVLLLRLLPAIRSSPLRRWTLVAVAVSWQPMLQTTLGGQNSALTLALLCGLALALARRSTAWSAIALGLLSYKPQYAVGAGIALAMAGQWPVAISGAALAALHWAIGAIAATPLWPLRMMELMRVYRPMELADNAETHFSWVRTADFVLPSPADGIVAAAGVAAVLALWWRYRALGRSGDPRWFALVLCGTMLMSPHQQYYDVALLLLPAAILVDRQIARDGALPLWQRLLLAAVYIGYPLWEKADALHVQPLFFVLLGVTIWALRYCKEAASAVR